MRERLAASRILLVDRLPPARAILTGILTRLGIPATSIHHAEHGQSALAQLAEQPADIVISALDFAPVSGLELLARIRQGESAAPANQPVLVVTADGTPEHRLAAARLAVDGVIAKPPHPLQVERSIIRLLATRRPAEPACCQVVRLPAALPADRTIVRPVLALTPGQMLTSDLLGHNGTLLLPRGSLLTAAVISVLLQYRRHFGIENATLLRATQPHEAAPVATPVATS
ncbi:response regulator [Laribacter hongkongensis]|uniref:Response regulator receiver domain n=13 Tax=Laribacter hongkongensis TaxID=168471 RepID=A0A248LNZ3_9NEIS|nr:response regulator [Laribacter hongkongensis]ASJ26181.1 response regulator receiver domain [Laribacter hongkongensis]MCG9041147.1 response regulator [Laribacter hongkongensis]MCG9068949.1 response regulator [Laribacter hongkongensis]MCG9077174.1 response regulator [Laribacter hongkongensis]MCG9088344.1 response regulator [Laribacter hongkongensis]